MVSGVAEVYREARAVMSQSTPVTVDTSKTKQARISMGVMGSVGVGLLAAGFSLDWGFLGMFWSGVLAVGSLGGLAMTFKSGGFAVAACPSCSAPMQLGQLGETFLHRCEKCGSYSHGKDTMTLVADDHVAESATFLSPLNNVGLRWPTNEAGELACPMCNADAQLRKIELGDLSAGAAIGVGGKITTYSFDVPQCPQHTDGIALEKEWDQEDQPLVLAFRSRAYQLRYNELNGY